MVKEKVKKLTTLQERFLTTFKTYKDPISLEDLADLLEWKISRVYGVLNALLFRNRLRVTKSKVLQGKRKQGGRYTKILYQFVSYSEESRGREDPEKIPVTEVNETNILDVMLDEPGIKNNTAVSKKIGHERCSVERGYHFLMAGISKSSGEFADFFGISEEQAMRLLATIAARYPSEIKVTMRACLQIDARKPQF